MCGFREELPLPLSHEVHSPVGQLVATSRRIGALGGNAVVYGEPGTGKEALAHLINEAAGGEAPFLLLRCRGREEGAIIRDLFGGPGGTHGGMLLEARGGTLLLEDVGELTVEIQGRLVHAIAAGSLPDTAGGARHLRLVGTTTRDLLPLVAGGAFRRDLYDLLSTKLRLPPVRERCDDVLAIVDRAWSLLGDRSVLGGGARALLRQYSWPGNAREIAEFVRRLATNSPGPVITVRDVERELFMMTTGLSCWGPPDDPVAIGASTTLEPIATGIRRILLEAGHPFVDEERVDLVSLLHSVESGLVDWALQRSGGSRTGAAQLLRIGRTTLVEKVRRRRGLPKLTVLSDHSSVPVGATEEYAQELKCLRTP